MATDNFDPDRNDPQIAAANGRDNGIAARSHAGTDAAARMAHDFVDRVATLAEESEERIRNAAQNAEQTLRESMDTARNKGQAAKESLGDLVQRHPWAAVGIAFGVGVLLATLARSGDKGD